MHRKFSVVGVYPVDAPEPCHMIEIQVDPSGESIDFGKITQEDPAQPQSNWQVAWHEQRVGDAQLGRWVFFFHYLQPKQPLLTPLGSIALPPVTPLPDRLRHIQYEQP
jgi:hypothetical protein